MRLLKRLLRGPHERRPRHLDSCAECRLRQRRERQYLERLRGAEVPVASNDLTARLLARTADLARNEAPGAPPPAHGFRPARGFRPALRAAVLVAGTAAAATALLGGSAYLLGGDRAPTAAGASAPVFLQRDLAASGAAAAVEAGPGAPTGWSLTGEPDFTPAGALTDEQLASLRSAGWTCPELRELGYHLVWARAGVHAGGDILELRLTDGRNFATVLEQHGGAPGSSAPDSSAQDSDTQDSNARESGVPGQTGRPGAGALTNPPAPVNVLTGRPATSDGFTAATLPAVADAAGDGAEAGRGTLWVHQAAPFAAIYQAGEVTFTYVSDRPAEQADDGVAALVRARSAAAGPAGSGAPGQAATVDGAGDNLAVRLERGMGRIMELLAP